jgi:hypothetical protein
MTGTSADCFAKRNIQHLLRCVSGNVRIKFSLTICEGCYDLSASARKGSGPPVEMTGQFCSAAGFVKRTFSSYCDAFREIEVLAG